MSWNINGIRNKLETEKCLQLILQHDVVFLNEIKCASKFCVPGFKTYVSKLNCDSPNRGGTALLLRNWLVPYVQSIDCTCIDQIWIKFSFCPKVEIGGCYIAPSDSPYYSHESISFVQERILSNKNLEYVLIGDVNCRFGDLLDKINLPFGWQRNQSEDNKPQPNMNARNFFHVLRDCDLIPLNNLSTSRSSFSGALTFRKKQQWISELDWCICTHNVLSCISKMSFNKDISLPSNHAPICIELNLPVSLEFVMDRAENLLGHACEISQTCLKTNTVRNQWRNQVGAGGAERPPGQHFWGNFLMRLLLVIFTGQRISNKFTSNIISMLDEYDI